MIMTWLFRINWIRLQQQEIIEFVVVVDRMCLSSNTGALTNGSIDILLLWVIICRVPLVTIVTVFNVGPSMLRYFALFYILESSKKLQMNHFIAPLKCIRIKGRRRFIREYKSLCNYLGNVTTNLPRTTRLTLPRCENTSASKCSHSMILQMIFRIFQFSREATKLYERCCVYLRWRRLIHQTPFLCRLISCRQLPANPPDPHCLYKYSSDDAEYTGKDLQARPSAMTINNSTGNRIGSQSGNSIG